MRTANNLVEKQFNPIPIYPLMIKTTYIQMLPQLVEFIHPKKNPNKIFQLQSN